MGTRIGWSGKGNHPCPLGEKEKALDWLERMYEEGLHNLLFIKTDFEFDPIRSEPQFQAILKEMNLAD